MHFKYVLSFSPGAGGHFLSNLICKSFLDPNKDYCTKDYNNEWAPDKRHILFLNYGHSLPKIDDTSDKILISHCPIDWYNFTCDQYHIIKDSPICKKLFYFKNLLGSGSGEIYQLFFEHKDVYDNLEMYHNIIEELIKDDEKRKLLTTDCKQNKNSHFIGDEQFLDINIRNDFTYLAYCYIIWMSKNENNFHKFMKHILNNVGCTSHRRKLIDENFEIDLEKIQRETDEATLFVTQNYNCSVWDYKDIFYNYKFFVKGYDQMIKDYVSDNEQILNNFLYYSDSI